jgi:MFS family permease
MKLIVTRPTAKDRRLKEPGSARDLTIIGISHAAQHAYTAGFGILLPFAIEYFHTNYAAVGVILSLSQIAGYGLQVLATVMARASARLLLTLQNLLSAVGALIGAIAPTLALFLTGRFLQALSGWPQHPVGSAFLSDRHPKRKSSVLSWHVTAGNIGTLIAPALMGYAIARGGFKFALVVLTVILVIAALVVAFAIRTRWVLPRNVDATTSARSTNKELFHLMRKPAIFALLISGVIAAGGQGIGIVGVYTPGYLREGLHLNALTISVILTFLYLGAVIGPVAMGWLADRTSHRLSLITNYAAGASAIALFSLAGSSTFLLALLGLLMGIFSYSELPLRQTLFSDYLPKGLDRAGFAIFFTISQSVGSLWVAIIGFVVTYVDFSAAFWLMALTFVVGGLIVIIGTMKQPPKPAIDS